MTAHRRHRLAATALAAGPIMLLVGLAVVAFSGWDMEQFRTVGAVAATTTAAAAAWVAFMVRRAGLGNTRYVGALGLALSVAAIAGAAGIAEHVTSPSSPAGVHDFLYLLGASISTVAILRHPDLGPTAQRARILVDSAIAALSVTVVLWIVAGRSLLERSDHPLTSMAIVLAVGAGLAVARTGLVVALSRERESHAEAVASLVTLGFAGAALGALLHLLDHAWSQPWLLVVGDSMLVAGFAVIGGAGLLMLGAPAKVPVVLPRRRARWLLDMTPIITSAVATLVVLADAAHTGRFDATASAVLTVVVSSVLLRQSLMLSDNRQLSTSLRSTVDDLERQATHDALTRLPNRHGLDARICTAMTAAATSGRVCAVYFVDVDHLKAVNDSLGHPAGDVLIRSTADRLRARVGDRVTRFGGDEFVLVVEDLASPHAAEELGRHLVDDTSRPIEMDGHRIRSSSSVGLSIAEPGAEPAELLRQADVALYRAKALGRHCVAVYRASEDASLGDQVDLEPELRRAIGRREFALHYQPIVDLQSGQVVSVESLLRWQHPERGLLGPAAFLDTAISSGLLGTIGAISLRQACEDFAAEGATWGGQEPPSVAVNLSSSELADRRVVDRVAAALADSGLAPRRLTIEITEDVIIDETVRATIDQLCALGVHLAIDDFGTGNSSLRQLGAYPADVLKIDKSFVDRLEDDPRSRAVTSAIIRLAGHLGLTTLAEGVETEGQARLLADIGCDRAQGWLFAAAMPFDELVRWCATGPVPGYGVSRDSVASASSMMRASSSATGGRSSIAPTT